jgi:hypothetical protein
MRTLVAAVLAASLICAPLAHADSGDQSSAEQAVLAIYAQVQRGCTPTMTSHVQGITWSSFYPASYGEGRIIDATPGLGGPFTVSYTNPKVGPAQDSAAGRAYGQWSVNLEFC